MVVTLAVWSLLVQIFCGLAIGNLIAFNGPLVPYAKDMSRCANRTQHWCEQAAAFSTCVWTESDGNGSASTASVPGARAACIDMCAERGVAPDSCGSDSQCQLTDGRCTSVGSLTTMWEALFASATLMGAPLGAILSIWALRRSPKFTCLVACGAFLFGSAVLTVAWQMWWKAGMVVARVIIGVSLGLFTTGPANYNVSLIDDVAMRLRIAPFFQIACTLGIFLTSAVGIALPSEDVNQDMISRFQFYIGFAWFIGLVTTFVCIRCPPLPTAMTTTSPVPVVNPQDSGINRLAWVPLSPSSSAPLRCLPFVTAVLLSFSAQFTGINAIMNYAASMSTAIGIRNPYVGNCAVMLWNFVTTLVSIPISRRKDVQPRKVFIGGIFVAAVACLMSGMPVMPGAMEDSNTRSAVAITGVAIFIAAFEIGVGSWYYLLAQDLFQEGRERQIGCALTNFVQLIFNLMIVFAYPYVTRALSLSDGQPHRGFAIVTIAFGVTGFLSVAGLLLLMRPTESEIERAAQQDTSLQVDGG